MQLSIVIPVYEEVTKIQMDILAAAAFLVKNKIAGEIIVVDDGSHDETTSVAQNTQINASILFKVIHYDQHRGKGHAIKTGITCSRGNFVLFIDSGSCIPYHNILLGLNLLLENRCDIAHASRTLPESQIVRPHLQSRRLSSWLFRKFITLVMGIPSYLTDTQCGLKIYNGNIGRELYQACMTDGFMFDIEIILRAVKRGYRIQEFPIEWTADLDSRLLLSRMPGRVIAELYQIRKFL
jgi:glycosyltransferase involved in cell wall biosynthesis